MVSCRGNFYPGSCGNPLHTGRYAGTGFNVNIGWPYGPAGNAEYLAAFHNVILPIAYEFEPDLVIVSAGFDAAEGDLIGRYVSFTCYIYLLLINMLNSPSAHQQDLSSTS